MTYVHDHAGEPMMSDRTSSPVIPNNAGHTMHELLHTWANYLCEDGVFP
jgi:hypothetical protein